MVLWNGGGVRTMTQLFDDHQWVLTAAFIPVIWAAVSDIRSFRIPNECSLALLALFAIYAFVSLSLEQVLSALLVGGIAFVVAYTFYALGQFGGGDVKLLSVLSIWAGPSSISEFIFVMAITGGLMAVLMLSRFKFSFAGLLKRLDQVSAADNILANRLPYGVAIASGGGAVLVQMAMVGS